MGEKVMKWFGMLWQSLLSVVKIVLQSKLVTRLPGHFSNPDELLILANGPSLKRTVEESADFVRGKTLLAVNFCVTSPMFEQLKPELYLIADPLFWIVPEKREQLFRTMAEKTTWDMNFLVPARALKNKEWQPLLAGNPHIRLYIYNTTPIEGFQGFCNWIFSKGWGVPRPHNVLIPSIAMGIRLPFKKIYLAGADHSWLPEITVTDDNVVLMHQKHFYDQNKSKAATVTQENLHSARLYTILYHMYVAFKSYFVLEDYARSRGKEVINVTPGSYIDAFKRMKI
ncbi:hypothetical protein [Mediterranea massiliensis]|jgi:hypothetical protein|uniref:hypothetical protein n=1 Tax=Mediterranea massiliensis TaxID=1841865 RepID=UPI0025A42AE4|nr:hypothetical protein [Mediterranea massiliensis]MDM8336424.1 hypothetical protein [Mediterranea massiliensis]